MKFHGAFVCSKCGQEFTIGLGPEKLGGLKQPKKIGVFIGEVAGVFAASCHEHEKDCKGSDCSTCQDEDKGCAWKSFFNNGASEIPCPERKPRAVKRAGK